MTDNDYVLRGMMWADNFWLFCDNREIDMHGERHHRGVTGPGHGTQAGIVVRKRTQFRREAEPEHGSYLFREVFEVLGSRYHRDGKGFQGAERTMCKGMGSWWRDKNIHRSKTVPMVTKCKRVHSRVYSTVLNGSINWPWSGAMINKIRAQEAKILRLTFRSRRMPDDTWGGLQIEDIKISTNKLEEDGPPTVD